MRLETLWTRVTNFKVRLDRLDAREEQVREEDDIDKLNGFTGPESYIDKMEQLNDEALRLWDEYEELKEHYDNVYKNCRKFYIERNTRKLRDLVRKSVRGYTADFNTLDAYLTRINGIFDQIHGLVRGATIKNISGVRNKSKTF